MALKPDDLFDHELMLRRDADELRKLWRDDTADTTELRAHARFMRDKAGKLDQIADLVKGLRGCWDMGGAELVRDGFKREAKAWDLSKTYVLAVDDARETVIQTDEAA